MSKALENKMLTLKRGVINDCSQPQFRNIQFQIQAIRDSLDVIEGNLIDYVDIHYTKDI